VEITIRPLATIAEYRAAEELQKAAWGVDDREVTPDHVLLTAQKNGGLTLGAFLPGGALAGFVFGFLGLAADGELKHCSHLAAVRPELWSKRIGYRLKLAQRDYVLSQGVGLITWTYDPLESRNAALNIRRLGATCRTYHHDLYGGMRDGLNAGLPSDRFEVDWRLDSAHVAERLAGAAALPGLAELTAAGATILNPPQPGPQPRPAEEEAPLAGARLLIAIPANFQALKSVDMGLARAWREQTGRLFAAAFAAGYTVSDFVHAGELSYYVVDPSSAAA
jgi:predicted GNAT superfamily acetyltransferase